MGANQTFIALALAVILFSIAACAKTVGIMAPDAGEPKRISEKNYEINRLQHAFTGEKMVMVKDWVAYTRKSKIKSLNHFTLQHPYASHSGARGDTYDITGTITEEGQTLYLVKIPGIDHLHFGVTENGQWTNFTVDDAGERRGTIMSLTPEDTKFELIEESRIDAAQGFVHFDVVYNGAKKDTILFLYREYTPDDAARPAFQRTLSYPIDTDTARFKQIRIKIHDASPHSISFTVLEDGLDG